MRNSMKLTDKELIEVLSRLLFESASLIRDLIFTGKKDLYQNRATDLLDAIDHYTGRKNEREDI